MASIAIVDDNADSARALSLLLRRAGYNAQFIPGGSIETLDAVKQARPDLLVLDVMMPGIDGLQLLRELRCDQLLKDMPVVMFSAVSDPRVQEEAQRLGAQDYLVKGSDWKTLLRHIEKNLTRSGPAG